MGLKSSKKVDTNRVELEVEVSAPEFEAAVNKAYKKNIGRMAVPGFRKGKAPRHLVEKLYGTGVFYDDAVNDLYPEALSKAIDESEYEYVEDKIDLDVLSVGSDGLAFKAVITVKPEIEIGEYKGLKAEKKEVPVTDEEVDAELTKLRERNSRLVDVEGRPAQKDDTVTFDFEGFVDGEPFDGGKAENHTLLIGSGQFIPGFEDQLIGRSTDEEFEVNVTFPEDYHAENLAGKPAVFKCRLHEIKVRELPELNDDFAKDVSEFDTLEELKADLRHNLEHRHEHEAEDAFESVLIDQLIDGMKGEIPEAMFDRRIDERIQEFSQRLQSQGLDLETYLQYTGMDNAAFRDGFREQAVKQVKLRLILEKIAKLENLSVSDEELEEEFQKMADQYQLELEKVKAFVPKDDLTKDLVVGKAMELVKDSAKAA